MAQKSLMAVFESKPLNADQSCLDKDKKNNRSLKSSHNLVNFIRNRELGVRDYRSAINWNYGTRHMLAHNLFKEHYIPLQRMNKVFCSQWLCSKQIMFGTKCNKLMVYNVKSRELHQIPSIKGHFEKSVNNQKGIYSIKINPSRTLLATGAHSSNDVAVYRLPTLDPIVLAEGAHEDIIINIEWLDNEFFVSGSRDATLALWQVKDQYEESFDADGDLIQPVTKLIHPKVLSACKEEVQLCSITHNKQSKEIVTLSPNGYVRFWDAEQLRQIVTRTLPYIHDFALSGAHIDVNSDGSLYAIGSHSSILLVEPKAMQTVIIVPAPYNIHGIKSLSFQDNIITIGTGSGLLRFYDVRAGTYLSSSFDSRRSVILKTTNSYFNHNENQYLPPAIFTHSYDYYGTRLFTAGGSVVANLCGSYASLWQ